MLKNPLKLPTVLKLVSFGASDLAQIAAAGHLPSTKWLVLRGAGRFSAQRLRARPVEPRSQSLSVKRPRRAVYDVDEPRPRPPQRCAFRGSLASQVVLPLLRMHCAKIAARPSCGVWKGPFRAFVIPRAFARVCCVERRWMALARSREAIEAPAAAAARATRLLLLPI